MVLFSCGESAKPSSTEETTFETTPGTEQVESDDKPVVKPVDYSKQLSQFIPKGYSVLDTASGNLNLDDYTDMILILKKDNEAEISDVVDNSGKRPLLILLGQADGTAKKAAKNDNTVLCVDCGGVFGDPYNGITIKNGYFSVEHYGGSNWRWTRIVTYKYDKKEQNWYLHKDGGMSYHTSEPENAEETVRTTKEFGKVKFVDFDVYKEQGE